MDKHTDNTRKGRHTERTREHGTQFENKRSTSARTRGLGQVLTSIHALDAADVPRLDGTVLPGALVAGDFAVGVRTGAVAKLPRVVVIKWAVLITGAT